MVNTESNVPSQDDLIDHEKVAKHKLRQKRSRWWLLVALVVVVVSYVAVMYVRNKDVYARVGNAVITVQQYNQSLAAYKKYGEDTHNNEINKNPAAYTSRELIVEKTLENDSKRYNMPVTDDDLAGVIRKYYPDLAPNMSSADVIKHAELGGNVVYKLTGNDALRSFRIQAMQDKLASTLLQAKDILSVSIRWDLNFENEKYKNLNQATVDSSAEQKLKEKFEPLFKSGASRDQIYALADYNENNYFDLEDKIDIHNATYAQVFQNISNKTAPTIFSSSVDVDAIAQLHKVGDTTPVIRSGGGYYAIYRAEKVSDGKYTDWLSYGDSAVKSANVYGAGLGIKKFLASANPSSAGLCTPVANSQEKNIISQLLAVFTGTEAEAACSTTGGHLTGWWGRVKDQNGNPLSGVGLVATSRGDTSNEYCGGYGSPHTDKNVTDSGGVFLTERGYSCMMHWNLTLTNLQSGCAIQSAVAMNGSSSAPLTHLGLTFFARNVGQQANGNISAIFHEIVVNCPLPPQNGSLTITHFVKGINDATYSEGIVPQNSPGRLQVDTCVVGTLYCNTNESPSVTFNNFPAGWHKITVVCGAPDKPPCLASDWVIDHIESYTPGAPVPGPYLMWPGGNNLVFPVGGNMSTQVRVFFRQTGPAKVTLNINGQHDGPNGGPIEIPSDSQVTATWYPNNANSCTTSNGAPGWAGQSYGGGDGSQDRSTDSNTEDATYTYTITCDGSGGSGSDSVTVRYRRQYLPWLQTKRGDVMVNDKITGQQTGKNGGRNTDNDSTKEAEYVIISKVSQNFCSLNRFAFGISSSSDEDSCTNNLYAPKVSNGSDVINGLNKFASSNVSACNADPSQPYQVESNNLPSSGVINDQSACGKIWKVSGDQTLAGYTVNRGTATLWVHGNLTITGNITNNFSGSYTGYQTPGLGIIVEGDITIDPSVTRIDATLFATGKIKTCSAYPNQACRNQLTVNGMVGAQNGFELGRNYFEQTGPNRSSNVPAELFAGAAQNIVLPLPGFEDRISSTATGLQYLTGELNPRF